MGEMYGAEWSPLASNRRHLLPSARPNRPQPSNRRPLLHPTRTPAPATLIQLRSGRAEFISTVSGARLLVGAQYIAPHLGKMWEITSFCRFLCSWPRREVVVAGV